MKTESQVRQKYAAILKTLLFLLIVPGTVIIWLPRWLGLLDLRLHRNLGTQIAGLIPLLTGSAILLHTAFNFAWTGLGTPAPIDAPKTLVTVGLYRYCRNPMYWGVLFALIGGFTLWATSPTWAVAYVVFFWTALNLFIRIYEEPALTRKFGSQYTTYCHDVHRWLPRIPSRV